jgi:hypothetical protein
VPLKRLFNTKIDVRGNSESTNSERITMLRDGFLALSQTVAHPVYHVPENVLDKELFDASTLHNALLAIPVNFGAISGIMILLVMFSWAGSQYPLLVKSRSRRLRMLYFLLFFFVIMFNPLQATRTFWLPIVMALLYPIECREPLHNKFTILAGNPLQRLDPGCE